MKLLQHGFVNNRVNKRESIRNKPTWVSQANSTGFDKLPEGEQRELALAAGNPNVAETFQLRMGVVVAVEGGASD